MLDRVCKRIYDETNFSISGLPLLLSVVIAYNGNCACSQEYVPSPILDYSAQTHSPSARHVDIEVGRDAPVIDGIGWAFGIPRKLLLWDRRADNHDISPQTVDEIACYVDSRGLHDMKVRVNQYDPGGEWQRLVQNKRVGAGWRYTIGTLTTLRYTLFPGRLFGRDHYNPYTDTLSVFSDAPALALAEAAYANDVHQRDFPGTYATVQALPLVAMWHETLATGEVLHYVSVNGSADDQRKVRRLMYARYGMELGGVVSAALPDGSSLYPVVGAIGGHAVASGESQREQRQALRRDLNRGVVNLNKILQASHRE